MNIVIFFILSLVTSVVYAADVTLTWNPIAESEIDAYVIGYGTSSGNYTQTQTCSTGAGGGCENDTTDTITGLNDGQTYFFAVRADDTDGDGIDSAYGNEIFVTAVDTANRANASFTVDDDIGNAPHTVNFTSTSTGYINGYFWFFGDGDISVGNTAQHTYTNPGSYTVYHVVTGPRGSDQATDVITVNSP